MSDEMYDLIIIGGGPSGLTAGIYSAREFLNTLLLEKSIIGGLPASTDLIENYPGFPEGIKGIDLMSKFRKQAERFGVKIKEFEEVNEVKREGNLIKVRTSLNEYIARALIVASGSIPKKLGVPGEEEFSGRGVSYCATCDGPLYKDKDVAVIGCGNSGLQEGETLLNYVKSITFVEFLPYIIAEKILQSRIKSHTNVKFLLNHQVVSINGGDFVSSITVRDRSSGEEKTVEVSAVFIYIGFLPNSKFLEGLIEFDSYGYIKTDEYMRTKTAGIFAAGDVRSKRFRQIDEACGEGTIAALSAIEYLKEIK